MGTRAPGVGFIPPLGVYPAPVGDLFVHEGLPARLQRFDADGNYLDAVRTDQAVPMAFDWATGSMRLYMVIFSPMGMEPHIRRFDGWEGSQVEGTVIGGEAARLLQELLEDEDSEFVLAATPDGDFVLADTATYRIVRFDAEGNRVAELGRRIERPIETEQELQQERGPHPASTGAGDSSSALVSRRARPGSCAGHLSSFS